MRYYKRKVLVIFVLILSFAFLSSLTFAQGNFFFLSNNLDHAHDGNYNTSANIFFEEGYIIYDLEDLGIEPGKVALFTMNASDGGSNQVKIESLNENEDVISGSENVISILGFKGGYQYVIDLQASYIRVNGIPDAALYIYEIEEDFSPPGPPRFIHANNLDHAYDGSYNTSANIFSGSGYIIYDLEDIGIDSGTDIVFTMNASDGEINSVTVLSLDEDFNVVDESTNNINIFGFKMRYDYTVPSEASYIKINGILDVALYIYEIEGAFSPSGPPRFIHANNLDHAYDGSYNTSANIFSGSGYIIYDLADIGIDAGTDIVFTMNASDGEINLVTVMSLDEDFNVIDESTENINIFGFKMRYGYAIPAGSSYIKINGILDVALYIYEIEEDFSPPGPTRYLQANNLDHAYDGSYNTSANIFSESGYIIYDLDDLGFSDYLGIHLIMNTRTGESAVVNVSALDSSFNLVAGSDKAITIEGFKNPYPYLIPATSKYLKIEGVVDNDLYIYEIIVCPNQNIPFAGNSSLLFTNNKDRTGTLLMNLASECNRSIDELGLDEVDVYIPWVGSWTTLAEMDSTGYWSVSLVSSVAGSYEILITRNGSIPYSRTWTFKVRGETLGLIDILITQLSWTGTWNTVFTDGPNSYPTQMTLTQTGSTVSGTYTYLSFNGTISGVADLFNLTGVSIEDGHEYPIEFTMNFDETSFTGLWYGNVGDDVPAGTWDGTRN